METSNHDTRKAERVRHRLPLETGLEAVEFALIAALIVGILVISMPILTDSIYGVYESVMTTINEANPNP